MDDIDSLILIGVLIALTAFSLQASLRLLE